MSELTVQKLHEVIGGRLCVAPAVRAAVEAMRVERIVTDSRKAAAGDVFWGLVGQRQDGADFSADAFQRGAVGTVAGRYVDAPPGCWAIQVDDALAALHALAAWRRRQFTGQVLAVTGSVGKTTTREMIHAVLGASLTGWASPQNYNNHVGLPLSLLGLRDEHEYAVLELAASSVGEIAGLARLATPQVGVVTRIADAHLGGFGSLEAIARAKMELATALPADGWAVLSGDDPWQRRLAEGLRAKIVWVGRSLDCDVQASSVQYASGRLDLTVDAARLRVAVWGRHHVPSVLAAVAVGRILGLSMEDIARGLDDFQPPPLRCQVMEVEGTTVINDTYNASPTAMRAALELLGEFDSPGRRIAVVGDMRELGPAATSVHRQIGEEVVTRGGADLLVACGDYALSVAEGAAAAGMPQRQIIACHSVAELAPHLRQSLSPGDVALVKGSRALALDRVVDEVRQPELRRAA